LVSVEDADMLALARELLDNLDWPRHATLELNASNDPHLWLVANEASAPK
jgi:2,4-dienoyl-CoA reductase-like NADH-dependent reductase (Old Yellow Enzyme family)